MKCNRRSRIASLVIGCVLLLPALPVAGQTQTDDSDTVTPIAFGVSEVSVVSDGRFWHDASGFHRRDQKLAATIDGDLVGTASMVNDADWAGPCDVESGVCSGSLAQFWDIEIETDTATWSGTVAIETGDEGANARGVIVGRHGSNDQVILIENIVDGENGVQLAGVLISLSGPIDGIHLTTTGCVTGPDTADGGFLGAQGIVADSGPARVGRHNVGINTPFGVHGEIQFIGQKGTLRGVYSAAVNQPHAHGSFVLAGQTGPYSGLVGYGRATSTVTEDERCDSGFFYSATWTGQARYVADPAAFLAPRVYFASPSDGQIVSSPVAVQIGADHVDIEAAGAARDGAGYLTLIIDGPCIGPGEPIPDDENHIQLTGGETSAEISLFTGEHRLCVQLTDGSGIAQPATDVITIIVTASDDGGGGGF